MAVKSQGNLIKPFCVIFNHFYYFVVHIYVIFSSIDIFMFSWQYITYKLYQEFSKNFFSGIPKGQLEHTIERMFIPVYVV